MTISGTHFSGYGMITTRPTVKPAFGARPETFEQSAQRRIPGAFEALIQRVPKGENEGRATTIPDRHLSTPSVPLTGTSPGGAVVTETGGVASGDATLTLTRGASSCKVDIVGSILNNNGAPIRTAFTLVIPDRPGEVLYGRGRPFSASGRDMFPAESSCTGITEFEMYPLHAALLGHILDALEGNKVQLALTLPAGYEDRDPRRW